MLIFKSSNFQIFKLESHSHNSINIAAVAFKFN